MLDRRGRFRRALPAREAAIVMSDDATEMSVHWDAARGRWLAVYVPTRVEGHLARDVVSRSASWPSTRVGT